MPVKIRHLKGSLYLVEDFNFWKTNSIIWVNEKGAFFINSTYQYKSAGRVEWKASSLTAEIFHGLILTGPKLHFAGASNYFSIRAIKVYAHYYTRSLFAQEWQKMIPTELSPIDAIIFSKKDGAELQRNLSKSEFIESGQIATAQFMEGEILVIDPRLEEMPGQIIVYFPKERILYGGDILSDPMLEKPFRKDTDQFRILMNYIRLLHPDLIISGHGKPILNLKKISPE
jgi:hypothetical protein